MSSVSRLLSYNVCVFSFLLYCRVTLPCAPHLITCAETNGGRVKQNVYPIVRMNNYRMSSFSINVVVNCVGKPSTAIYTERLPVITYLDKCRLQSVWKKPRQHFHELYVKPIDISLHRYCTYVRYPVLLNKTVQKKLRALPCSSTPWNRSRWRPGSSTW